MAIMGVMIALLLLLLGRTKANLSSKHEGSRPWSPYLLKEFSWNASALSLTSLHVNFDNKAPLWVDHLFGSKSVFWKMAGGEGKGRNITNTLEEGRRSVIDKIKMPSIMVTPSCSIEFLGFGSVQQGNEPFTFETKHQTPAVGDGRLTWAAHLNQPAWPCYYRGTYDNWRSSERMGKEPIYWPTFIFCTSPVMLPNNDPSCDWLRDQLPQQQSLSISASLSLHLAQHTWIAPFNLTVNPREYEFTTNRGVNLKPTPALAVCTSMPYLSSVPSKRASVNAIFFEWVRYYASLGIHTVVYDSHGVQKKQLSSSRYVMMQSLKPGVLRRLTHHMDYHNYSILSHLYPTMREWYYDNSEGLNRRLVKFDDDHTYTLTHCRFDVQARLGVRKVLVADFDEFLYCPSAGNTAKEQGQFIDEVLSLIDLQQVDQLLLFQHGLMNRTRMRLQDCVAKEASGLVTTSSIFNCFSSHNYPAASYLHKSLHASKACPFNTDHHACSFTAQLKPQDYDCLCDTLVTRICTLIHLSQRDGDIRSTAIDPFIRDSPLELPQIIKSEAYVKNYVVPLTLT